MVPISDFSLDQIPWIDWSEDDSVLDDNSETEIISEFSNIKPVNSKWGILENIDFSIDYIYRIEKYTLIYPAFLP